MAGRVGVYEKTPEQIVQEVTKTLRAPQFTIDLIVDINQESAEKFQTLCDLFTKYRKGDCATDDRLNIFSSALQKKNGEFSSRQISSIRLSNTTELEEESEKVITEFWTLVPDVYKTSVFAQHFHQLVRGLKPEPMQFPVLDAEFAKLSNPKMSEVTQLFLKELTSLHEIQTQRYEAAKQLYVYVTSTASSTDRVIPEVFRRLGRFEQTVNNKGVPIGRIYASLTSYQIRLPKSDIPSSEVEEEDSNTLVETLTSSTTSSSSSILSSPIESGGTASSKTPSSDSSKTGGESTGVGATDSSSGSKGSSSKFNKPINGGTHGSKSFKSEPSKTSRISSPGVSTLTKPSGGIGNPKSTLTHSLGDSNGST